MHKWVMLGLVGLAIVIAVPVTWWATRPGDGGARVDAPVPPAVVTPTGRDGTSAGGGPTPATRSATVSRSATPKTRLARTAVTARAGRTRLSVPSLGIDAPIVPVGVRPDGTMDIPEPVQDVGWYKFGPAPGAASGSAVLAGHVDSARQGKGALFDLRGVDVGARIDITLASGRTVHYRVTGRETFVKQRLPTERLFARDGGPRLVIITCGGPFIQRLSSYRDNLVVAAEPLR